MEFGCYESDGFAKVDINNNKDDITVQLTAFHESIHKLLAENSSYGLIVCLLTNIMSSDCLDKDVYAKLNSMHGILMNRMLQVQESTAVFAELCLAKITNIDLFERKLEDYRAEKYYYNTCRFKDTENLLYYMPTEKIMKLILACLLRECTERTFCIYLLMYKLNTFTMIF